MGGVSGDEALVEEFLARLREIPWFAQLGDASLGNSAVQWIGRWEDWPGPQEPSVTILHEGQQELHDSIMAEAGGTRDRLIAL